jgi:cytosine/adenosine deaminase-related metal-dependent hydrolase
MTKLLNLLSFFRDGEEREDIEIQNARIAGSKVIATLPNDTEEAIPIEDVKLYKVRGKIHMPQR